MREYVCSFPWSAGPGVQKNFEPEHPPQEGVTPRAAVMRSFLNFSFNTVCVLCLALRVSHPPADPPTSRLDRVCINVHVRACGETLLRLPPQSHSISRRAQSIHVWKKSDLIQERKVYIHIHIYTYMYIYTHVCILHVCIYMRCTESVRCPLAFKLSVVDPLSFPPNKGWVVPSPS